jgi:hypothetical protein
MYGHTVRFGGGHSQRYHVEKGFGQVGLLQSLSRMDEKTADALGGHLINLTTDFIGSEAVIPKPERI